ncbi:hypothetical protein FB567DRAFT_620388 [Paraphoma chrysanthemicola]|uniref:SnoaL-like domain-containing protein n=1 Tax=Paraphoma chrysanthemicola TaxID=798071 RepID=A0A8K0R9N4_9PLEO|nr:hypothetical protein FB567DRAFT_620388 [Paraphoma chrysanthemicola]
MVVWNDETTFTQVSDLAKQIPGGPSKDHKPDLASVEQEILQHYKDFGHFCNKVCKDDPDAGRRFYDLSEAMSFDLMGTVARPGFRAHYDNITPYLADAQIAFKDMEIVAVTTEFAYVTAVQRYWGTAADGNDFDFTFRTTSLLRKRGSEWKYVHEHFSFPVDMATQRADLTNGTDLNSAMKLEK